MIAVHGIPVSPFVRKVHLVLRYKGIEFDLKPVMPGDTSEEFGKISPLRKVPVLEHDGFTIPDSSVILRYIDQTHPEKPIYPSDPKLQAKAGWLEEFGDTRLIENLGPIFFQRVVRPNFMSEETDEAIVQEKVETDLPPILSYLDSILPDSGYAVGDHLTAADVAIISPLLNGRYGGFTPDSGKYPKVAAYLDRALEADIVKTQLAIEKEMLGLG